MTSTDIDKAIDDFKATFLPKDFVWRRGQREAIVQIIETYVEGKHKVVILDAPVGSGKSIIGMATSYVLNKMKKFGYILASDIALQEQYEKDFKNLNLRWGSVKGIDNYDCIDNGEKNSLGTCRIRNKNPKKMYCYDDCPYFSARDHASVTPTSLLNYAYWLIMMNYVNPHSDDPLFPPRDFLICDEGHKLLDIVQSHYSPRFNDKIEPKLKVLTDFFNDHNIRDHDRQLRSITRDSMLIETEEKNEELLKILERVEKNLESFLPSVDVLKKTVDKQYKDSSPPKEWKRALRNSDWLKDFHCKVEDYVEIINKTSTDHLVKNPGMKEIVFNCLEESYMMNKYFHEWSNFTVIMSATFSDPSQYVKSIALKGAKYIKMDSFFDFEKSPIYFYNDYKMSYNHIERNLPWLRKKVNDILEEHKGERGLIHTASYSLAMKIMEGLSEENSKRVLVYNGTEEKREMLERLKRDDAKVVMGPSLLEGLDMKDDWSRFQVFAKVPYLSLGDRFVKKKMEKDPGWYRWKAIINILQGVGRSVRNNSDWAVTYILDGSLVDLMHRNPRAFPPEFRNRMKLVKE